MDRENLTSYVLFRTKATVKFIKSKLCCNLELLYEYCTYSHQRLQTHMFPQCTDKPDNVYCHVGHFKIFACLCY